MIPSYLDDFVAAGAEVSVIADPRQVLIDCRGCRIRDEHLSKLAFEPDLTALWLHGCDVGNQAVSQLAANRRLETLDIGWTRVTGEILKCVPNWPELIRLGLENVAGIDAEVQHLTSHAQLSYVDLQFTDITPPSLALLLRNSLIEFVDVTCTTIDEAHITAFDDFGAAPSRLVTVKYGKVEPFSRLAIDVGIAPALRDRTCRK